MESRAQNPLNLLNSKFNLIEEALKIKNDTKTQLNENAETQLLNPEVLKIKASSLLSSINNPEIERDFRRTSLLYKNNITPSSELNEAYQEYVKAYHKATSLYLSSRLDKRTNLFIYDTENEIEEAIQLETPEKIDNSTWIVQLPNGELFCYAHSNPLSGATLIIDHNNIVRQLPYGAPYEHPLAIYFNRSVYCLGGWDYNNSVSPSSRFDLDQNRWIKLTPLSKHISWGNSVIFKGNILIVGYNNRNLWLYSIDIDSFSKIPCDFTKHTIKILVNAKDTLYSIECPNGRIFESEVGYEYAWKIIGDSIINLLSSRVYWKYNKGQVYIGCIQFEGWPDRENHYFKFSLDKKVLIKLK